MLGEMVTLSPRGTARRIVPVEMIQLPALEDVECLTVFLTAEQADDIRDCWLAASEMRRLAGRRGAGFAPKTVGYFVPDLWHTAGILRLAERRLLIEMWHRTHDLAEHLGLEGHSLQFDGSVPFRAGTAYSGTCNIGGD
jgi:hypothetical protein